MSSVSKFPNIERNILEVSSPLTQGNAAIPPAVIINMDKDKQRLDDIKEHFLMWGVHAARLPAIEGVNLPVTNMTTSEISCALSHASAMRYMMLADGHKYMHSKAWLIVEDDCRFVMNPKMAIVWALMNVPYDWSIISLGSYNKDRPPLKDKAYRLYTGFEWYPWGAHAYLVNPTHASRLMGALSSCTAPVDHIFRAEFKTGKGFLMRPSVAYQEIYESNIADWGKRKSVKHHADLWEDDLKILIEEDEKSNNT